MGCVLIVDDEAEIRETVACVLEEEGFSVDRAENGRAALEKISERPDALCVVLLDLMMPVMSGHDVLEILTERGMAAPPIVVMSAYELHSNVQARVSRTLKKPFRLADLVGAVEAFCRPTESPETAP